MSSHFRADTFFAKRAIGIKPLNKKGVERGLFAATRTECLNKPFMRNLIDLAGQEAGRLQKSLDSL